MRHGLAAVTIMPVLPQEDPGELEKRILEWGSDLQPQTAAERELVKEAVRLSYAIARGERMETAHMSRRVRLAARNRLLKLDDERRKHIRELGRRLLYVVGSEEVHIDKQPPWTDDPWLLVRELEDSAEGCRWLIERWEEFRNLLDYIAKWDEPVLIRFIRLQGKNLVEAVFDPALNSIFLAWDVLVPKLEGEVGRDDSRVASEAPGSEPLPAAGVPPLPRPDALDSPGGGQKKSGTRRVTLADLTRIIALLPR